MRPETSGAVLARESLLVMSLTSKVRKMTCSSRVSQLLRLRGVALRTDGTSPGCARRLTQRRPASREALVAKVQCCAKASRVL